MFTYQDFLKYSDKTEAIHKLIADHTNSDLYKTAKVADMYDHQRNKTINEYVKVLYDLSGAQMENFIATNSKIASNFFHRLNTQRCTYSLGNGVSFTRKEERTDESGVKNTVDVTKERLGVQFDADLQKVGYKALIHGVTFGYWNSKRLYNFTVLEFAPMWDETTGALRAGVRFWQLAPEKPIIAVLYEEDGYTKYKSVSDKGGYHFVETQAKTAYKLQVVTTPVDGEVVVGEENYTGLPVVAMWGSQLHQSTLVGMQQSIDSFDLIRSGFANDLSDCSEVYWLLENYGGMDNNDLRQFRDKLKFMHIADVDTQQGGRVTPYTQEIPYAARQAYLTDIRAGIYEDFGGLDVHAVAAGATNDHIDAAYQPMDENADDFEFQVIEFVQSVLALEGIEDTPVFKRNRISNQMEQTEMVLQSADYLDEETVLQKLPFITTDEIPGILARRDAQDRDRMTSGPEEDPDNPFGDNPDDDNDGGTPPQATGGRSSAQE